MNYLFNLQHLKFFFDSVNYSSVTEAAKMNFVTQSAVSQGISKLEKQFGAPLLFFNKQRVHLTPEGKVLYDHSAKIFSYVQQTFHKISEIQEDISGTVRFVTTKSLGQSLIPEVYKRLKEEAPQINLQFKMGGPNLIRSALKSEEAEFAIVVFGEAFDQYEKSTIHKGEFKLYQSIHAPKKCLDEGVLVDRHGGLYVDKLTEFLNAKSIPVSSFGAGWDFVARCTDLGLGVGFFPDYIAFDDRYPNLKPVSMKTPSFPYEICIVKAKGTSLTRCAQTFIERFLR